MTHCTFGYIIQPNYLHIYIVIQLTFKDPYKRPSDQIKRLSWILFDPIVFFEKKLETKYLHIH